MKVLFLLKSLKTPSSRIRILDIMPELEKLGIRCDYETFPRNIIKRYVLFRKCEKYDAVVFQKKLLNSIEFAILRKHSRFLVFDYDDAIYYKNASPSQEMKDYLSSTSERRFRRIIEKCDLVVAANRVLASKAGETTPDSKIRIIPSPVKIDEILSRSDTEIRGIPVIGWIGMKGNLTFIEYISDALRELRKKQDFVLKIISDNSIEIPGIKIEFVKWSLDAQNRKIRSFDIGIMPLSADPYSEGKAAYKLIQYLAAGVPSVCSPVGMNLDFCRNDEYAISAEKSEDFAEKILLLVKNCKIRAILSESGKKLVRERFDIGVVAKSYAEALKDNLPQKG